MLNQISKLVKLRSAAGTNIVYFRSWPVQIYRKTFFTKTCPNNVLESDGRHPPLHTMAFPVVDLENILICSSFAVDSAGKVRCVLQLLYEAELTLKVKKSNIVW